MKMCHRHTNLIFNLFTSPHHAFPSQFPHSRALMAPTADVHASYDTNKQHTHFLHSLFVLKMLPQLSDSNRLLLLYIRSYVNVTVGADVA